MVKSHADKLAAMKSRLELDPEALRWSPLVGAPGVVCSDEDPSFVSDGAAETAIEDVEESVADPVDDEEDTRLSTKKRGRKSKPAAQKKVVNIIQPRRKGPKVEPRLRARPSVEPTTPIPAEIIEKKSEPPPVNNRRKVLPVDEDEASPSEAIRPRKRRNIEPSVEAAVSPIKMETSVSVNTSQNRRVSKLPVAATKAEETKVEEVKEISAPNSPAVAVALSPVKKRGRPRKRARPQAVAAIDETADSETIEAKEEQDQMEVSSAAPTPPPALAEEDSNENELQQSVKSPDLETPSSPERPKSSHSEVEQTPTSRPVSQSNDSSEPEPVSESPVPAVAAADVAEDSDSSTYMSPAAVSEPEESKPPSSPIPVQPEEEMTENSAHFHSSTPPPPPPPPSTVPENKSVEETPILQQEVEKVEEKEGNSFQSAEIETDKENVQMDENSSNREKVEEVEQENHLPPPPPPRSVQE